ncbi:LCP family protein [Microbacterium sp.]|uniref:LCP family glycopolymer transferase n=1 Tax=Microbacterium sp. TaxID=51671 RepID=UPI0037CCABEB
MSDLPRAPRRRTVARHARLSSPSPFGQLATLLAIALAVVLVSGASTAAFYAWNAVETAAASGVDIGEGEQQLPPTIGEYEGGVNLLIVGTDSCEGQDLALFPRCRHDQGGERNDVTMLVHIGDDPRRVTVVSFPRDMLVPVPQCPDGEGGYYSAMSSPMMNATYVYGGLPCTVLTIEALTGINVDFAAAIRWTGVINMSDAIGGVQVCVAEDIRDRHTGLSLKAGTPTLKGVQALQFLRIRHGIGDGSDLSRISNQQQFMSSMVRKLQSEEVLSNPVTLFNLANTAIQQMNDRQLTLSNGLTNPTRMVQIAMAVKDVPFSDITFIQYPTGYVQDGDGNRVVPLRDAADVLFTALGDNRPIRITGKTSPGASNSQEVKGEIQPTPQPTATPGATASPTDAPTATPVDAVELPSVITGQTANQVTCTLRERG